MQLFPLYFSFKFLLWKPKEANNIHHIILIMILAQIYVKFVITKLMLITITYMQKILMLCYIMQYKARNYKL